MPPILRWFTANIGAHHVHHLGSKIPFYRLPQVLKDQPDLDAMGRVTLRQAFQAIRLGLWDEASERLVSFRYAAQSRNPVASDLKSKARLGRPRRGRDDSAGPPPAPNVLAPTDAPGADRADRA
jgi:hypothetical protein